MYNGYSTGEQVYFIVNDKKLDSSPQYFYGTKVYFYLSDKNAGGKVNVDIINEAKNKIEYLPTLDRYITSPPDCNTEEGVTFAILPPGKYEFFASSETKIWKNTIEIGDNDCRSIHLQTK